MQKALLLFLLSGISFISGAQQYNISGKLKDNEGKPLVSATVSLLKVSDSSWVRSEFTGDTGNFNFKNIAAGEYLVDVFATGYKTSKQKIVLTGDITNLHITVQKSNTQLKEVVVTDKKPFIEQGLGKTIINLSSSITTAGSNVLDLLRRSPGITVDMNGNVTMQGKQGVLVLIDNKETYLSGQQLADYLRSLSAEQVAQLELITQPSARYDAEGNAGIINIKTKKNKKQGMNGTAVASYKQGVYPGTINSINLEQTKNKLHLEASYSLLHMQGLLVSNGWHIVKDPATGKTLYHLDEDGFLIEIFEDHNLKFGGNYALSDKTTIDGSITGIYHTNSEYDAVNNSIIDPSSIYTYSTARTQRGFIRKNILANAGYRHEFNKTSNIAVVTDYLKREENDHDDVVNSNFDATMHPVAGGETTRDYHPSVIDAYTLRADYTGQLKNNIKLEAGLKTSYVTIQDQIAFSVLNNNVFIPDTVRSNDFNFHENINAAYITASKNFGKKWETQAGLRCENTNNMGRQVVGQQAFQNNSTSVFPTLFVAYTLNNKNRFEFNYGRRISRPAYTWLNPFRRYLSQYNYEEGNSWLQPEYSNNIELKHTYNNKLTTTCSYSHITGLTSDTYFTSGAATHKEILNIGQNDELGINITSNTSIRKWWTLSLMGMYSLANFQGNLNGKDFNVTGTRCHMHANNQFSFEKGWAAELTYFAALYNIERLMTYEEPRQWMSLGFSKKMFNDTTTVRLSIEDPFDSYRYIPDIEWDNLSSRVVNKWDNQQLNISLTYNFGKTARASRNHDATEEQNRMGM